MAKLDKAARASGKSSSAAEQLDSVRQIVFPTVLAAFLCSPMQCLFRADAR